MSKKLLVIDDEVGICRTISRIAQQQGFDVRAVADSRQAIDAFRAFWPDLVILDLVMPNVDGIGVLHDIIATGIPAVIVLTTGSGIGDAYLRIAEGVVRFHGIVQLAVLRKPFRRAELLEVLNRIPRAADFGPVSSE